MDNQDHKTTTAASAGHEGHGAHTCHRCGWPFPNPHPSAKHRRAHKKVCGTIEGYKNIQSEDDDSHLAVSVEEHASDDDAHSPSPAPTPAKERSLELSGSIGVGEKSNKSEDDVFCDAVTEFSDGGKSQKMEPRFDSVIGKDNTEQKGVEVSSQLLKVDDETAEQLIDPTSSGEISNPGAPMNANDGSENVMFRIDNVDPVNEETLLGLRDSVQPKLIKEDILLSEDAESESKISGPSLTAVEDNKDISDNLTSMVEHDVSPEAETPENMDTTAKEPSVANFVGLADSIRTATGNVPSKSSHETIDASMVDEVSDSAVVENNSIKLSDEESSVSSHAKDDTGKTFLNEDENVDNLDSSGVEKHDMDRNKNGNLEFDDKLPTESVSSTGLIGDSFATENDQTVCSVEKIPSNCDGKSKDNELSEAGNEIGSESAVEVQREVDCSMPSMSSNPVPSSPETDTNAIISEESAKTDSNCLKPKDTGHEKSFEGNDTDKETGMQPVGSAGLEHDVVDSVYRRRPGTTSEDSILPMNSELPKSNVMSSDVRVESINDGGLVCESGQDIHVVTSDKTVEHPSSIDTISFSSESIDATEVSDERNLDRSIVAESAKSDNSIFSEHEALPSKLEGENETMTDTYGHKGEVVNAEKLDVPIANVSSEDREPAPSSFQDSRETSVKCEDENIESVEHDGAFASKSLQDKSDEKVTEQKNGVSAKESSGALSSRCDSLEANYGSVSAVSQSSDTLETGKQKEKDTETQTDKSEVFEPPSFMTLVQPRAKPNQETDTISEIGTVQHNQSNSLQAGWFPSLTNVVNESEGRKKNEEMIAKVTNWSPVKQHGPLKTLLNEVKSPNTKQVPTSNEKQETEIQDKGADSTTETKNMEEWNSPARYPIETKKEKKKKRPYWVPFVCCSSVHGDL